MKNYYRIFIAFIFFLVNIDPSYSETTVEEVSFPPREIFSDLLKYADQGVPEGKSTPVCADVDKVAGRIYSDEESNWRIFRSEQKGNLESELIKAIEAFKKRDREYMLSISHPNTKKNMYGFNLQPKPFLKQFGAVI